MKSLLAGWLALAIWHSHALAEQLVLRPVADTSLSEPRPANNFGASQRLLVGNESDGRARSLVRFDLSSVAPTSQVVYAAMRVTSFYPPSDSGRNLADVWLFRMLRAWNEGSKAAPLGEPDTGDGAAWLFARNSNDAWREPGAQYQTDFNYLASAAAFPNHDADLVFERIDMARDVQAWIDNPAANHGWMLYHRLDADKGVRTDENGVAHPFYQFSLVHFASREDSDNAPELTIHTGNPDAPRVFVNGEFVPGDLALVELPGRARVESPFSNGHVFYTLDGTKPTLGSARYTNAIPVTFDHVLRAVSYSADYSSGGVETAAIRFAELPKLSLNFSSSDGGTIIIDGHAQPSAGFFQTGSNRVLRVQAAANAGFRFVDWTGDAPSTQTQLRLTMDRERTIRANFVRIAPALTVRRIQSEWLLFRFMNETEFEGQIERSTDLENWASVRTFTARVGDVEEILPFDPAAGGAFYRLAVPPATTAALPRNAPPY